MKNIFYLGKALLLFKIRNISYGKVVDNVKYGNTFG